MSVILWDVTVCNPLSTSFQQTTQCYVPEDMTLYNHTTAMKTSDHTFCSVAKQHLASEDAPPPPHWS
jgi:hypothetical protein